MRGLLVLLAGLPFVAIAQLKLAKIFSDNMLLQREQPIHIWGKSIPGTRVTVLFAKERRNAVVQNDSTWVVSLPKQNANTQPQPVFIISGNEKITLKNILIGDVWLCIGQSNMEWPMMKEMHFKEEISNSQQPLLRLYNPAYAGKNTFGVSFTDSIVQNLTTENFYKGQWQDCDSNSFRTMSAVGYYFGKEILQSENIPVGLINLSIGGAPLESFISREAMKSSGQFAKKIKGDWLVNDALPVWVRERGKQNVLDNSIVYADEYGKNHAFKPGFAFSGGIEPLLRMAIKGIICYQGESNAQEMERVKEYGDLCKLMVNDFRKKWNQSQLPFYYVQLSSIDTIKYKGQLWPQFRNEQRIIMEMIPYSGMAVCSDIGFKDDVHPTNKREVGKRLARWALNKTYKKNIVPSGPLPLNASYHHGYLTIQFHYTAGGLQTSDSKPLRGFSVDGKTESIAIIQNRQVVIREKGKPDFVYYGWKPYSDANLVNSEKLPASTFKLRVQ
jgi:sialate O-acetylesterase